MDIDAPPPWTTKAQRLLVPVIASFLCFIFTAIRPWGGIAGQYAFLPYTSLLLFFFPSGNIRTQLELTFYSLSGAILGLAWANGTLAIAAVCGRRYGADSDAARGIIGLGLGVLSFVCGFLRSWSPRLTVASRIALFFPIFLWTSTQDIVHMQAAYFLNQFYVTLFAAIFGLVPALCLSRQSSLPRLGSLFHGIFDATCQILPLSLSGVLQDDVDDTQSIPSFDPEASGKAAQPSVTAQDKLAQRLRYLVAQLAPTHKAIGLDLVRARASPSELAPIVLAVQRIHRNPLLGPTSHSPGERIRAALEKAADPWSTPMSVTRPGTPRSGKDSRQRKGIQDGAMEGMPQTFSIMLQRKLEGIDEPSGKSTPTSPGPATPALEDDLAPGEAKSLSATCDSLVVAIMAALQATDGELADIYIWPQARTGPSQIKKAQYGLRVGLAELQKCLARMLDDISYSQVPSHELPRSPASSHHDRTRSKIHSKAVTFDEETAPPRGEGDRRAGREHFRLAFYMISLLDLGKDILALVDLVQKRTATLPDHLQWYLPSFDWRFHIGAIPGLSRIVYKNETTTEETNSEDDRALDDEPRTYENMDFATAVMHQRHRHPVERTSLSLRIEHAWRHVWDHPGTLYWRVTVSRFLHQAKHSPHIKFAIKQAAGIMLLAIPALLGPGSAGRKLYSSSRGAWGVISFMYVLEVHTGATMKIGFYRIVGTFLGAVGGFVCTIIAHRNPYALVTLATAFSVPISYVIMFTSFPAVGTISGITLPPIMFLSYLNLNDGQSAWTISWHRFVEIAIGIAAAVLIGILIWPNHARVRYFRAVSVTLERATEYYLRMSRDLLRSSLVYQDNAKQYAGIEADVRRNIAMSRNLIAIQRKEVSLLPRPIRLYSEVVDGVERLIETLIEIRALRFSVPRKATVLDVLPIRRELISAVLVTLWTCGQAFRSHSPLPQFLPSARTPLEELMQAVDVQAREVRHRSSSTSRADGGVELAILYAMAENEALGELCNILDELVAAARTLFGAHTFLDAREHWKKEGDADASREG